MALVVNERRELIIQAEPGSNDKLLYEAGYNQGVMDSHEGFSYLVDKPDCTVEKMRKYVKNMLASVRQERLKIDEDIEKGEIGK